MGRKRGKPRKGQYYRCHTWFERVPKRESVGNNLYRVRCQCSWRSRPMAYEYLSREANAHTWARIFGSEARR